MTQTDQMIELMEGPRGAVMPVPDKPLAYWVKGSEQVYEVKLAHPDSEDFDSCECNGFQYRGRCAHVQAAAREYMRTRPEALPYTQEEFRRMMA